MAPGKWAKAAFGKIGLGVILATAAVPAARAVITPEARACFAAVEAAAGGHGREICASALSAGRISAEGLASAFGNRGRAHLTLKEYAKARRAFIKAIELTPDRASAYNDLGLSLAAEGRHESAIRQFDAAIKRDAGYAEAYLNRALSNRALGAFDAALSDFGETRRLAPALIETHRRRIGGMAPAALSEAPSADAAPELATGDVAADKARETEPKPAPLGSTLTSMLDYDSAIAAQSRPRAKPKREAQAPSPSRGAPSLAEHERALKADPALVRRYQQALAEAGYAPGPIDGLYGPSTRAALAACLSDGNGAVLR